MPCSLRQSTFAGHDADVFAIAPGGQGGTPCDPFAVAKDGHAVDGFHEGTVVTQEDMTNSFLVKGG